MRDKGAGAGASAVGAAAAAAAPKKKRRVPPTPPRPRADVTTNADQARAQRQIFQDQQRDARTKSRAEPVSQKKRKGYDITIGRTPSILPGMPDIARTMHVPGYQEIPISGEEHTAAGLGLSLEDYRSLKKSGAHENSLLKHIEDTTRFALGVGPNSSPGGAALQGGLFLTPGGRLAKIGEKLGLGVAEREAEKVATKTVIRKLPADMPPEVQAVANKVTSGLAFGRAKQLAEEKAALHSTERAARAAKGAEILGKTPGLEGAKAAKRALRGPLPDVGFDALKGKLSNQDIDHLYTYVSQTDRLRFYQKIRTHTALTKLIQGRLPTPGERKLLNHTFGPDFTKVIIDAAPEIKRNPILDALNLPRSLLASFDISAPFRQGLVAGARHPVMFAKNFREMMRAFRSPGAFHSIMAEIDSRPTRDLMDRAGLNLTVPSGELGLREEQFPSQLAERIPGVGIGVRASSRAYMGFLDKMRADMFDYHLSAATKLVGRELNDEELKSIGRFINAATGRGDLGALQGAAVQLNTVFFSPRLLASRLNFLDPRLLYGGGFYGNLSPYARKEAMRSMQNLVGFVGSILMMAHMAGAKVELDPRNSNWAKIKIGDTRIDLLGGFQQPVRIVAQIATGHAISSTTDRDITLGPGYGKMNRFDIAERFVRGKLAPSPSFVVDWLKGSDFQNNPFDLKKEAIQRFIPLAMQDANDLYTHTSGREMWQGKFDPSAAGLALAGYAGSGSGIGVQTYGLHDVFKKNHKKLLEDAKHAGMTPPSPHVIEDLQWKTKLDAEIHDKAEDSLSGRIDYEKAAKVAVEIFEARYKRSAGVNLKQLAGHPAAAKYVYRSLRSALYPQYAAYHESLVQAEAGIEANYH